MGQYIAAVQRNFSAHFSPYDCGRTPDLNIPTFQLGMKQKQVGKIESEVYTIERKPKCLCLHGFRTSGDILKTQLRKWPRSVREKMNLVFVDAPFPCHGKSDVEGIFDPPYYEWFQFNKEKTEYKNFEECVAYIEECMIKYGPIDGLLGFSQGAVLCAALSGLQAKGLALTKIPRIKFLIIIGGVMMKNSWWAEKMYSPPIRCPSIHFLGEADFLKQEGIKLVESFVDPLVIHHRKGHEVPRLDERGMEIMLSFLEMIQKVVADKDDKDQAQNHQPLGDQVKEEYKIAIKSVAKR